MKLVNESNNIEQFIKQEIAHVLKVSMDDLPINLSVRETAKIIGTTERSLNTSRHFKRNEDLPYYKMGKRVLYPLWGIVQYKLNNLRIVSPKKLNQSSKNV